MSQGMVRIELHDASHREYEILHKAAEAEGFSHTVTVGGHEKYMPHGTYFATSSSASDLLVKAERAAKKTGKAYSIVVAANGEVRVTGLKPVFRQAYGSP